MDSTRSPTGSVRRHMPRRSTRGPLTAEDDPLANPAPSPSVTSTPSAEAVSRLSLDGSTVERPQPRVNLAFLQNAAIYQPTPTDDVHESFLNAPSLPSEDMSLATLLQRGLFRRAAETARTELLQSASNDAAKIFELLYTRLACLVLISRPDIASHESTPLIDALARSPAAAEELVSLIPWELRLLLVRLQSIAAADGGRRAIMSLYSLASEVRQHVKSASNDNRGDELKLWFVRLRDLGLRVIDALVEMGELETATRQLDTLTGVDENEFAYRKALLRLRLGDLVGARNCIEQLKESARKHSVDALLDFATGDHAKAILQWQECRDNDPDYALLASNLAVSLLYTGRISEARSTLERLAERVPAFPGLLFNLGTVYELCTEQAIEKKAALAEKMASKEMIPDAGGWERAAFEFKL